MIITSIETFPLRIPFRPGNRPANSAWGRKGQQSVDSLLVRVTTDQGIDGWGESFGFAGVPVTQRAIDAVIAPMCVGQDATRIGPLMTEIQEKLAVYGRGGPFTHALSAIDIALWDIAGKGAGAPLHRLLGGGRDELPCYASLDAYADPDLVRADVRKAVDAGFSGVKLHERDLTVIRAGREEAGPDVALMIDVNTAWTLNQAGRKRPNCARSSRSGWKNRSGRRRTTTASRICAPPATSRSRRARTCRPCWTSAACWTRERSTTSSRARPRWAA
jgi:L-alanine-DL-glutamate epimerase-like enolase superfamily enzyme